jgi:hypothetical protein
VSNRKAIGIGLTGFAAVVIALATLTPVHASDIGPGGNPICLICGELGGTDALLNTLLFMPLGLGLALAGLRHSQALAASALISLAIELLQFQIVPGRDASLGDVMTNSVGGFLGAVLAGHLAGLLLPTPQSARRLSVGWSLVFLVIQSISSFGLHPLPTASQYFGQTSRSLEEVPQFPGRVMFAAVDGVPMLSPTSDAQSARIREALATRDGAMTEVQVIPGPPEPAFSTILRLADREEREILGLFAEGTSVMYMVRSGAAVLRLRPIAFAAREVLGTTGLGGLAASEAVHLKARWAAKEVLLSHERGMAHTQARLRVTSAAGWRLFAPLRVVVDGSRLDSSLDAVWLMLLLVPLGYWSGMAWATAASSRNASAAIAGVLVIAGMIVGPIVFGEAFPAWWELAGAGVGGMVGMQVARVVRHRRPVAMDH